MNTSNQIHSDANYTHTLTNNKPDKDFIQIINGVKLTLGFDPNNHFNLSILRDQRAYQTDARGYYDKSQPVLDPLEWLKSEVGQKYIAKTCSNSEIIIFASKYQHSDRYPATIYTKSFYVWLGYLKHCIGDIDTALSAELAN